MTRYIEGATRLNPVIEPCKRSDDIPIARGVDPDTLHCCNGLPSH